MAPSAESTLLQYEQGVQSKAEVVVAGKSHAEEFEQAQLYITRLEQELENAKARRDDALEKINENLGKAKTAEKKCPNPEQPAPSLQNYHPSPIIYAQGSCKPT